MKPLTPEALRDTTFERLQAGLAGARAAAFAACVAHGPGTTAELAARSGMSLLTLRPRLTELQALGLVRCVGARREGRAVSGIYQAVVATDQWAGWRDAQELRSSQLQMGVNDRGDLTL